MKLSKETKVLAILLALFLLIGIGCGVAVATSDSEPLYVIDGVVFGNTLNSINPNDIESLQVLQDAASCAIYGSRAANGVILIT